MVARKRDGRSVVLPKLVPETAQEYDWYLQSESKYYHKMIWNLVCSELYTKH
jgi:hypothetical protein